MGSEGKVWDVVTGRLVHALKPLNRGIRRVEFSPDGKRIATTDSSDGARLWDAATGQPISPLLNHRGQRGALTPAGFSHDGRWLLNYSWSAGSVAVWDAHIGGKVGAQIEHGITIVAPPVFSPDDSCVVTSGADNTVRMWDARTGLLIAEPMRQGSPVNRVSFSPDGRFILTQGANLPTRIWAAPPAAGGSVPDWLLRLATLQAGMVVNDDGNPVAATAELAGWDELRAEVNALPSNAPYAAWGKWLVAPRETRPISPGFAISLKEAAERGLIESTVTPAPAENAAGQSSRR